MKGGAVTHKAHLAPVATDTRTVASIRAPLGRPVKHRVLRSTSLDIRQY